MAKKSLEIAKGSPLHAKLIKKLESRIRMAQEEQCKNHGRWQDAEERTLAYLPETEVDAGRRHHREDGTPSYTTIQIPYTYAVMMSAHTYWTSVFFARNPIHQFSGRHGEGEMQIQAMEALIAYQTEVGAAVAPYYIWLYDAGKYGMGVLGQYWCEEKLHYGQLVEMTDPSTGKTGMYQTTQEVMGFRGNKCYNVSPYDFLPDPRVSIKNFQKGEFCAVRCELGWNQILRRKDSGYFNENIQFLKEHVGADTKRSDGSAVLVRPNFTKWLWNDDQEANKHPAGACFYEVYVDLVPKEWEIGGTAFPQKWCFTITDDFSLIVGATPLGYVHCQFPFDIAEPEIEGYGVTTRGIPEIVSGIQNTVDWLINSHFFNVRASLNNQFIVDPSKLVIKDVQKGGPGFLWRLRPEAYGTDLSKMFMQVPVTDVTRTHIADFQTMLGIGERTLGVNDQIMGALNATGRKTATEVRTTTGFGVNRQKTITEYMSASAFSPHAQKLVQSSQQFYDASAKLRIVGSFAQDAGSGFIQVTPDDIAGFYDLVPVDGTLPIDRMAQANLWKELMGGLRMMPPQVAAGYDWMRIFGWVAQLSGLKNINQFRVQVVPDAKLQQQAQAGNVVQMPPRGAPAALPSPIEPGNSASTAAGLDSLGGEGGAGY